MVLSEAVVSRAMPEASPLKVVRADGGRVVSLGELVRGLFEHRQCIGSVVRMKGGVPVESASVAEAPPDAPISDQDPVVCGTDIACQHIQQPSCILHALDVSLLPFSVPDFAKWFLCSRRRGEVLRCT